MKKLEFALLVVFGVVQTVLYFTVFAWQPPDIDPAKPIFQFASEEKISYVEIARKDSPTLVIELRSDGYWLTKPVQKKADSFLIKDIVMALERLNRLRIYPATPERIADAGLDDPDLKVHIKTRTKEEVTRELTLRFGKKVPFASGGVEYYYFMHGDEKYIYQMFKDDYRIFTLGVKDWRSKQILEFKQESVNEIQISGLYFPDQAKIVRRGRYKDWILVEPYEELLEQTKVNNLLYLMSEIYAKDYLDKDIPELETPDYKVFLKFSDESSVTLRIRLKEELLKGIVGDGEEDDKDKKNGEDSGGEKKERRVALFYAYLEGSDEAYLVESEKFYMLPKNIDDLRYRLLYRFREDDIRSIDIISYKGDQKKQLLIEKKTGVMKHQGRDVPFVRFDVTKPEHILVPKKDKDLFEKQQRYINEFIEQLRRAEILAFMHKVSKSTVEQLVDLQKPECKVTFLVGDSPREFYFKEMPSHAFAFTPVGNSEYEMFKVAKGYVKRLKRGHFNFYVDPIWSFDYQKLRRLVIYIRSEPGGSDMSLSKFTKQEFTRDKHGWKCDREGYVADESRLEVFLKHKLSKLEGVQVVSDDPEDLQRFGLLDPYMICVVELENGQVYRLKISEKFPADMYLATTDGQLIFQVDPTLITALKGEFYIKKSK